MTASGHPPGSHRWLAALLCMGLGSLCCMGASAADSTRDPLVLKGRDLARIACSKCHVVASDTEAPAPVYDAAPRFDEIANRRGVSEQSLRRFITTTHWDGETIPITMPRLELTKQQVTSLARYIMSLKKR